MSFSDLVEQMQPQFRSLWFRFEPLYLDAGTVLSGGVDLKKGLYFLVEGEAELHLELEVPPLLHVNYHAGSMPGSFLLLHPQNSHLCRFHITENSSLLFMEKNTCFQVMANSPDFAMMVLEQASVELGSLAKITKLISTTN